MASIDKLRLKKTAPVISLSMCRANTTTKEVSGPKDSKAITTKRAKVCEKSQLINLSSSPPGKEKTNPRSTEEVLLKHRQILNMTARRVSVVEQFIASL